MAIVTFFVPLSPFTATAGEVVFPSGSVINVTDPEFNFDWGNPATHGPAIQAAIRRALSVTGPYSVPGGTGQYVYLPNGEYIIDSPLVAKYDGVNWMTGLCLIGQSRENTIIRLKDESGEFQNANSPRGIITTAGGSSSGDGVSGFNNFILNLTIDAGKDNPGALGIDFVGNNVSGVQNVTIVSRLNSSQQRLGKAGISMHRRTCGPGLIKNVLIEGFDLGLEFEAPNQGINEGVTMTVEGLVLRNQRVAGINTAHAMISIRGLNSINQVPALKVGSVDGMAFLTDATLTGLSANSSAIVTAKHLFARNVSTTGYQSAISVDQTNVLGNSHVEYSTSPVSSLFPSPTKSLNLPVREVREYWDPNLSHWHAMPDPGPENGGQGDADRINDAINYAVQNGKTTLWFPRGVYRIKKTILIHGNIRHILGIGTHLLPDTTISLSEPMIRLKDLTSPIRIEHLNFGHWNEPRAKAVGISHESPQELTLSQICKFENVATATAYSAGPGAGNVFIENVGGTGMAKWHFSRGQKVWATQFNVEGADYLIKNFGADLWIHGLKTEMFATVIETQNQGRTELIGGILKGTFHKPEVPAFINNASSVSLGYVDNPVKDTIACKINPSCAYPIQVREIRGGITRNKLEPNGSLISGSYGTICPLYVGYPVPADYPDHVSHPVMDASWHMPPAVVGTTPALLMDKTEVIQNSYAKLMASFTGFNSSPSSFPDEANPVETMTYFEAILYCNRRSRMEGLDTVYSYGPVILDTWGRCPSLSGLSQNISKNGYRLPLEAEWSAAYRARTTTATYWGAEETALHAWYSVNSAKTSQVAKKKENPWGLFDMAGNVAEWVWSEAPSQGIVMGGSYVSTGSGSLSYNSKSLVAKSGSYSNVGFRVVRLAPTQASHVMQSASFP